ncbi:hypothetical protein FPV67DRAFT_38253 [Lyophyllum atratum]|nr:hypothetical protein FPV67DRAFT_38253 [Lyophyllum atratum]
MGNVIETVHSGNDMVVDETTNAPSPMYDERQAGAIFEHLTSGEDIDMADGITKTITLDESPPQNAQVASSLVRQMDGLASTDVNIATHSTSHSVSQPTTSANMDIDGTVLDISPAAPDASMVAENKNVRFQTRQLSLPQRGQMAAVGVTSAYTAEQISPGLEGGVLEPSGTQNLITTPTTTLPPSVTGATHQHPLPPATHSLMPKTWSPLPSKPNSPLNSPIVPSRAGSTSSRAASVIGDPLLPRTAVYPTLINDADHPPVSPSRKALESMVMARYRSFSSFVHV